MAKQKHMEGRSTMKLLAELSEKHREIKNDILVLLSKLEKSTITPEFMKDELFKIYLKVK